MPDNTALMPQPKKRSRLVPDLSTKPFDDDDVLDGLRNLSDPPQNDNPAL